MTVFVVATTLWVTVKTFDFVPAAMVTVAGTVAAVVSELVREMTLPLEAAGASSVKVPFTDVAEPPTTVVVLSLKPISAGGFTVRTADFVNVFSVPEIVTFVEIFTEV